MVFQSSINPIFPDPPNWTQQQQGGGSDNHLPPHLLVLPPPPSGRGGGGDGGGASSIRPSSMANRARLAKIPQPDAALKCPRCESTNTKFCYFNNYNLAQPRHFCKTCRRYWTRGGALRNVPVGGGCRKNKRSKRNRSKSPVTAEHHHAGSSSSNTTDIIGHLASPQIQLPFFPPLHNLGDFSFRSIPPHPVAAGGGGGGGSDIEFQIGTSSSGVLADQWRLQQVQQFPFLSNLEPPSIGLYSFEGGGVEPPSYGGQLPRPRPALDSISTGIITQMAAVKMEENHQRLSRNFLGLPGNHDHHQYWSASTDLSGFNSSSSTSHFL